jgi:hypothetical protein
MPQEAKPACMQMQRDTTPGLSESFYFCKNSLARPMYSIVQHYSGENFAGIFNFDPRGANIICNEYEFDKFTESLCRKVGIREIKNKYEAGKTVIQTVNLSKSKEIDYKKIYERKSVFLYPETAEEIVVDNCFVHISTKQIITIGYDINDYMSLSTCLIKMEQNFQSNKKLFLKLIR